MATATASHGPATNETHHVRQPALRKKFGFMSMLGISFVVIGTWTSAGSSMNLALPSGGCVATLYGLIVAGIGSTAVAASLAELCSVYPTNGAQYEWTAALAPPKYERYLSYICGWVVTASWWALSAAGPSLVASLAIGLISLYAENYEFQRWHQFLIFLGVEVVAAVTNALGTALLPWIGKASFMLSLSGLVAISITVLACSAGHYQSAGFVFTKFINRTGWNDGAAWLLGLLQGCFSLVAYDATAHLVEEMPNPRKDCPRTMVLSIPLGTLTGFAFLTCVLFGVRNVDEVISSPFGPLVVIFKQATGSKAATIALTMIILTVVVFSAIEVLTSSSRLTAAFASHGGLPFGKTLSKVNEKLDLPIYSMFVTNAVVVILGLIYLGASTAFNAIISSCVIGLNLSYLIPILILLTRGRQILPPAPFSLGRYGYAVNILGAIYLIFTTILFFFPTTPHPDASTMNYSIAIIGGIVVLATLWWFISGNKHFESPVVRIVEIGIQDDSWFVGEAVIGSEGHVPKRDRPEQE